MGQKETVWLWRLCFFMGLLSGMVGCCLPGLCFQETDQYYRRIYAVTTSCAEPGKNRYFIFLEQADRLWNALHKPQLLLPYLGMKLATPLLLFGIFRKEKRQRYLWLYTGAEFLALSLHTALLYGAGGFPMVYRWIPWGWIGTVVRLFILSKTIVL